MKGRLTMFRVRMINIRSHHYERMTEIYLRKMRNHHESNKWEYWFRKSKRYMDKNMKLLNKKFKIFGIN